MLQASVSLSSGVQPLKLLWLSRVTIPPNLFSPSLSDLKEKWRMRELLYFSELANKSPCDTGHANRPFLRDFCPTHRIRLSCKHSWCKECNSINLKIPLIYRKTILFCSKSIFLFQYVYSGVFITVFYWVFSPYFWAHQNQ